MMFFSLLIKPPIFGQFETPWHSCDVTVIDCFVWVVTISVQEEMSKNIEAETKYRQHLEINPGKLRRQGSRSYDISNWQNRFEMSGMI